MAQGKPSPAWRIHEPGRSMLGERATRRVIGPHASVATGEKRVSPTPHGPLVGSAWT